MRIGVGIAAGAVGFVVYGTLYFLAFSSLFGDPEIAMRLALVGMLLSGVCFLVGFRLLDGEGLLLFGKALALPLAGAAALAIGMLAIKVISSNVLGILFASILGFLAGLYQFVDSLIAGVPFVV